MKKNVKKVENKGIDSTELIMALDELEKEESITVEDEYALCDWDYILEEIYRNYRDLVYDNVLFNAIGLCHVLRKRSSVEGELKND